MSNERILVEAIKKTDKLSLVLRNNDGYMVTLHLEHDSKLYHDIALAVQSAIIKNNSKHLTA